MILTHICTKEAAKKAGREFYLHQFKIGVYKLLTVFTITRPTNTSFHISIYWD